MIEKRSFLLCHKLRKRNCVKILEYCENCFCYLNNADHMKSLHDIRAEKKHHDNDVNILTN